ncbi:hypothetical protein ACOZ38_25565 [Sphaerisporangium viridialbum]|uniref:hypothetical protein n=1 Tax=Sphaerisporangium viridialbum TaxID=46189 RepID=UPI003C779CA1
MTARRCASTMLRLGCSAATRSIVDLTGQVTELTEELDAARTANRELITRLDTAAQRPI